MLKTIRKNTKIIVWSVILAFSLWGAYSVTSEIRSDSMYAGKVFGQKISHQEFNGFFRSSLLFSDKDPAQQTPEALRAAAWQGVIFSREAKQQKIEVTDEEVRKQILELLETQKISLENYEQWLQGIRMNPPLSAKEFETQIREMLRIRKWAKKIEESSDTQISEEEVKKTYFDENNQLSLEILTFPTEKEAVDFRSKIKKDKDWDKVTKSKQEEIKRTGLVGINRLVMMLQVTPENFQKIQSSEIGTITEPLASGTEWAIFRLLDKTSTTEQRFEEEKESYLKNMKDQKAQMVLMTKSTEIIARAKLEDYQAPVAAPPSA